MEPASLIAALLGSGGISALIVSASSVRPSKGLLGRLEHIEKALKCVGEGAEGQALRLARKKVALELAAQNLDPSPSNRRVLQWVCACAVYWSLYLALFGSEIQLEPLWHEPLLLVGYLAALLAAALVGLSAMAVVQARRRAGLALLLAEANWDEQRALRMALITPTLRLYDEMSDRERVKQLRQIVDGHDINEWMPREQSVLTRWVSIGLAQVGRGPLRRPRPDTHVAEANDPDQTDQE